MPPRLQVTLCLKGRSHVDLFDLLSGPINLVPCPNCSALVFLTSLRELPNQLFSEKVFLEETKLLLFWVTSFGKESNSKNWWFTNHLVRNRLATKPWDLLINLISGGLLMLMLIWTFQGLLNIDAPIPLWRHFGDSWHQLRVSEMLWDLRTKPDKKLVFVWNMRAA